MFAFLRCKQSSFLGLEINSDEIRLLQLKRKNGGFIVKNHALLPLPVGVVTAGKIWQPQVLQELLSQWVKQARVEKCAVIVALPGNAVISQQISLPASLSTLDCEAAISSNLSTYFPGITESLCFDFFPLTPRNTSQQDVLLVACRRAQVHSYTSIIEAVGLCIQAVDVDKFALMRAVRLTVNSYSANDTVALLQLGDRQAELIIFRHQTIFFNQQWQLDDEHSLLDALKNTWQLYFGKTDQLTVDYVILSGKLASYHNVLTTYLSGELKLKIFIANPFTAMDVTDEQLWQDAASFQLCAGLATRRG